MHPDADKTFQVISVFNKAVVVPGFRHRIVNPSDVPKLLPQAKCTKAVLTPWIMEEIARRPDAEELLKDFEMVAFGGGVYFQALLCSQATPNTDFMPS